MFSSTWIVRCHPHPRIEFGIWSVSSSSDGTRRGKLLRILRLGIQNPQLPLDSDSVIRWFESSHPSQFFCSFIKLVICITDSKIYTSVMRFPARPPQISFCTPTCRHDAPDACLWASWVLGSRRGVGRVGERFVTKDGGRRRKLLELTLLP